MARYRRDEEAIADAIKGARRGERDVQRPTGTEKAQTAKLAEETAAKIEDLDPLISDAVPKAPTGLTIISNVGAFTVAGPVATVTVGWDPVTESTDDDPITVSEYEVWDAGVPLYRIPAPPGVITVPSGLSTEVRVLARTPAGVAGDLSAPLAVTGASPSVADRDPSAPTLTSGASNVIARWDGTYTGGGTTGANAVWVEASLDEVAWVRQGAALTGAGSTLVRLGDVDDTVYVRLAAYDQLGRLTGLSTAVSIVVVGIDGDDIIAGTIYADALEPNIGDSLNLYANEAINMIVGRQDGLDAAVAHAQETADDAAAAADAAGVQAGTAIADAAVAAGQALVAQTTANTANTKADNLGLAVRLTVDGVIVGRPDASAELRLTPEEIQIVQGGVPASVWSAGRMTVNEIIVNRGQIANHVVEKSGTTRTVINLT